MEQISIMAGVIGRKLEIGDAQRHYLVESISRWADGPVTVTIKRERPEKSQLQLGYYYGCQLPMIVEEACGSADDPQETHRIHMRLKAMLLPPEVVEWTDPESGEIIRKEVIPSLADLNTVQMSDFSERVNQWALDFFNLVIPPPDPNWRARRKVA